MQDGERFPSITTIDIGIDITWESDGDGTTPELGEPD
jgi:hypothetical protein